LRLASGVGTLLLEGHLGSLEVVLLLLDLLDVDFYLSDQHSNAVELFAKLGDQLVVGDGDGREQALPDSFL